MSGLEIAGFIIGITGLATVFDKVSEIWLVVVEAQEYGDKVADALSKLQMEFFRFQSWWAVLEKLVADPVNKRSRSSSSLPAGGIVSHLQKTVKDPVTLAASNVLKLLQDFEKILVANGALTIVARQDQPAKGAPTTLLDRSQQRQRGRDALSETLRRSTPFLRRLKYSSKPWSGPDAEKVESILRDINYWNNSLYDILPSKIRDSVLEYGIAGYVLNSEEEAQSFAGTLDATGQNWLAVECAKLMDLRGRMRLTAGKELDPASQSDLDHMNQTSKFQGKLPASLNADTPLSVIQLRGRAKANVIEWYPYPPLQAGPAIYNIAQGRMARLSYLLQKDVKPSTLHSLSSEGYLEATSARAFGLVSELPEWCPSDAQAVTLHALLAPKGRDRAIQRHLPTLQQRLELAVVAANSLYTFMLCRWHHKRFHASSIYFLLSQADLKDGPLDLSNPCVGGYAVSRPDAPSEDTFPGMPAKETELYLHPELRLSHDRAHQRYKRIYEIYSFGILLAEIGYWTTLPRFALGREKNKEVSAEELREKAIRECQSSLACWAGSRYRDVVLRCLRVGMHGGVTDDLNELYWNVVLELTNCT